MTRAETAVNVRVFWLKWLFVSNGRYGQVYVFYKVWATK